MFPNLKFQVLKITLEVVGSLVNSRSSVIRLNLVLAILPLRRKNGGGGYGSLFLSRWWKTKSLRDTHLKPMLSLRQTKTFLVNVLVKGSTKFSTEGILSTILSPFKLSQHFKAQAHNPSFS